MVDATALPNHILSMDDLKVVVERMGEAVKAQKHHRFFEMIGWNQPIRVWMKEEIRRAARNQPS